MRTKILVTPLVAVLAASAPSASLKAQDLTSAVLTGTVTGPDNKPLPKVRVYLTSPTLLSPRDGRTDEKGQFRFSLLPPGMYTITYSADGFISRKSEMQLVAGIVANGSIKLRAMDVQGETIEIVADVSNTITPDKTDTSVQTAFTSSRLEQIGAGRGVAAMQELTPGINGSITNITGGFNIRGGLNRSNKIMQDGQIVGDALYGVLLNTGETIEDLIESISIIQSPLNAKLGNTDGGIISIITKRGGNMFSGSLRYSGQRGNGWGAYAVTYPDMLGYQAAPNRPSDDNFSRSWQYSLSGPIIPNYLTFTIGGNITPTTYTNNAFSLTGSDPATGFVAFDLTQAWGRWDSAYAYLARMGTFYLDNDTHSPYYGNMVRAANWGAVTSRDAIAYGMRETGNQTFSLYLQAHPNHQFTYYYTQGYDNSNINGAFNMGDIDPEYGAFTDTRAWNISYKAVLGATGILDARYGRSQNYRDQRKAGRESVQNKFYYTYWNKIDGSSPRPNVLGSMVNANNMDQEYFNNFMANGIIDNAWSVYTTAQYGNWAPIFFNTIGINGSGSNGSVTNNINVNYMHMLEFKGQHNIDVGFEIVDANAPGIPSGARNYAGPVGQISWDLDDSQIGLMNMASFGLPGGTYSRAPVNRYRGKYIVFDVRSKISDLEPHVLTRPRYGVDSAANWLSDGPIWDVANNRLHPQLGDTGAMRIWDLPFMNARWGSDVGDMVNVTSSYYLNDMWTINENHSFMLGLRGDSFLLKDSSRTVHSYLKITPRFEYKFDLQGDQKHLFAASYAQFHQMAPMLLYWPFIRTKWGNTSYKLWTGDKVDSSKKTSNGLGYYLVDIEDILNPDNYGITRGENLSGEWFGDVDKGFRPPTSTEYSVWYRHSFGNGGFIRINFNTRTWSDLYDMFPGEVFEFTNPNTGAKSNRLKTVLKNTDDFFRSYNGLELQWDFPITKKIAFGGSYTYSSFKHNQTSIGTSAQAFSNSEATPAMQTPWWFDERFSTPVTVNGETVYNFGTRDWSQTKKQGSDFKITYYIIVDVSQGRARSNFTLRGGYTGPSTNYDSANVQFGVVKIPPITNFDVDGYNGQLLNQLDVPFNSYTSGETFYNSLAYNLSMPLVKRLSWFLNVNVNNVFNNVPKSPSVPGGMYPNTSSATAIRPWALYYSETGIAYQQNWNTATLWNPFRDGWTWPGGNMDGYLNARDRNQRRSISMSTGVRF